MIVPVPVHCFSITFFGCLEVNVLNGTGNATRYDWCMKYQRIQYLDQFHIFEDKSTGTHFLPIKVIFNSKTQFSGTLFYSALPLEKTTPSSMFQESHLSSAVFSHILRVLNVDYRKAFMSAKCSLNDSASPQFSCLLRYWCTSMPIIRMSGDVCRVFETNISNAFNWSVTSTSLPDYGCCKPQVIPKIGQAITVLNF